MAPVRMIAQLPNRLAPDYALDDLFRLDPRISRKTFILYSITFLMAFLCVITLFIFVLYKTAYVDNMRTIDEEQPIEQQRKKNRRHGDPYYIRCLFDSDEVVFESVARPGDAYYVRYLDESDEIEFERICRAVQV